MASKKGKKLSAYFKPRIDEFRSDVIKELGKSPQDIAKNLKKLGIKGEPDDPNSCPLACYLTKRGFDDASVDGNFEVSVERGTYEVEMPQAYHKFVEQFDEGKYPELIDS